MEERKRHIIVWNIARPIAMAAAKLLFRYDAEVCREEGPLLVLANHNADLDPLFVSYSFPMPLYFVGSEHIMRSGWISDFLRWATVIITRQKGGNAAGTVREIIRHLQNGHDVCLFPEGNRSWDGVTRSITPATGKMARISGAKLITYRVEGGYLSSPRWSGSSVRRGRTHGEVIGVYEPEYLKTLNANQVLEIIERDLRENAYERQRESMIKYRGRNLAQHLETLLFMCPHCRAEGKMRSHANSFICDECGTELRYTAEGFFAGKNVIYDNVRDWNIWQNGLIRKKCETAGDTPIFSDTCISMSEVKSGECAEYMTTGTLTLYRDRLVLPNGTDIPLHRISGMSLRGPQDMYLSAEGVNYILKSSEVRCTHKYLEACKVFESNLRYGI